MINPKVSESTLKKGDFICHLSLCLVAALVALQFTDILDLLNAMYTFCAACCFAPFIGGLFWKHGTAKGALASSVIGLILVTLSLTKLLVLPLLDFTPIIIAVVVYVIVSLLDKEGQKKNQERLAKQ